MTDVEIITSQAKCESFWSLHRVGLPDGDFALRRSIAEIYGVQPHFILHQPTGSILPLGEVDGRFIFYGGKKYNERNHIIGNIKEAKNILNHLIAENSEFNLLSWDVDPLASFGRAGSLYDVPFNQYWVCQPDASMECYLQRLSLKRASLAEYAQRKYRFNRLDASSWTKVRAEIDAFIEATSTAFAKRGRSFALDQAQARAAALETCRAAHEAGSLVCMELVYQGARVGLVVIVDDKRSDRACFLLSLRNPSPSDISDGAIMAVVDYSITHQREVDGMRGAFTLKREYGFKPQPSFALVKDNSWRVTMPTDLTEMQMKELYGRSFGKKS